MNEQGTTEAKQREAISLNEEFSQRLKMAEVRVKDLRRGLEDAQMVEHAFRSALEMLNQPNKMPSDY